MAGDRGYSTPPKRIGRPSASIVDEIRFHSLRIGQLVMIVVTWFPFSSSSSTSQVHRVTNHPGAAIRDPVVSARPSALGSRAESGVAPGIHVSRRSIPTVNRALANYRIVDGKAGETAEAVLADVGGGE
jgi:hypothetical protein